MKRLAAIIFVLAYLLSCSEETDIRSVAEHRERLIVEAVITDQEDRIQKVILSKTVPYYSKETAAPVSGASVEIDAGGTTIGFKEVPEGSGTYIAPVGFRGVEGKKYHLGITLQDGSFYEADATMPHNGFRLDEIDYAFAGNKSLGVDSLWTLAIWGKDMEQTDYYYVTVGVNDHFYPFEISQVTDDKYFNGNVVNGFPIATLLQVYWRKNLYGDCCKYLETGDVVTLEALTLDKGFYDFLVSMTLNGSLSAIPLFSPQPANCPTNIKGENVLGYFAVCPTSSATVKVDDPQRPYYKRMM